MSEMSEQYAGDGTNDILSQDNPGGPPVHPPVPPPPESVKSWPSSTHSTVKPIDRQVAGAHYKNLYPEPWAVMEGWNKEHFIGFLRYCALKRLGRWDSKDSALQEVKKAIHELEQLVEVMERPE